MAPCYTTCSVRENPPSLTQIMQLPRSLYLFLAPISVFSSPLFFLRSFASSPPTVHSILFLPPGMWKDLLPATCCVCECLGTRACKVSKCTHACVQSYILDGELLSKCFAGQHYNRWSLWSLWWWELTFQLEVRCWETQNAKQPCTQISFDCRVLHFNPMSCFWTLAVWKQRECKIILAQRTGGAVDFYIAARPPL